MRRYFPRRRDETFAGRPPRRSNAEKEQVDRVDLYCELVLQMIRKLSDVLNIPTDVLVQEY